MKIVSLIITEKGPTHLPASGDLNDGHFDILHDLNNPQPTLQLIISFAPYNVAVIQALPRSLF